jgi:hypothetical protein
MGNGEPDNFDVLIRTGISDPIAIALAESLLEEAGIPYVFMDRSVAPRQKSGNFFGWLTIRVPQEKESESRDILESIEQAK